MSITEHATRAKSARLNPREPAPVVQVQVKPAIRPSLKIRAPAGTESGSGLEYDESSIGLALGSPGHGPFSRHPLDDRVVDVSHNDKLLNDRSCRRNPRDGDGTVTEIGSGGHDAKRRNKKWNPFGSLFGKKDLGARHSEPSPFYRLDRVPEHALREQRPHPHGSEANTLRHKRADSSRSKPGTDLSHRTTKGEGISLLRRNSSRRKGLLRRRAEETKSDHYTVHTALPTHQEVEGLQPSPAATQRLLLEVEIPNVELDRYSVMFGDLLNAQSQSRPQSKREPSFLTLKQAQLKGPSSGTRPNIDQRRPSEGLLRLPRKQRSSISSKTSKMQSSTLVPSPISTPPHPARCFVDKPLPQSDYFGLLKMTPHASTPSDLPQIQHGKPEDQDRVFVILHKDGLPPTPKLRSRRNSSDSPYTVTNSNRASFFGCPEFLEPSRLSLNLGTASIADGNTREASPNRTLPTRTSSIKKLTQPPENADRSPCAQNPSVGTAAEISIARQISISRRQQQLLVPIAPKLARQPRQPRLVNRVSTPAARKSHHLTLEDA